MKTKPNNLYSIIGIAAVLFLIGLFGLIAWQGQLFIQKTKENIELYVELSNNYTNGPKKIQSYLSQLEYIIPNSIVFRSKEDGIELMQKDLGADIEEIGIGNPLFDVITFRIKSKFINAEGLNNIKKELNKNEEVIQVYYEEELMTKLADNLYKISYISLVLGVMLVFIAIIIINNSIKLSLYANRFTIKNMELVGAKWEYIAGPYLKKSIKHGLISSGIAIISLSLLAYLTLKIIPRLAETNPFITFMTMSMTLSLLGILISYGSTYFVINKYLKMRVDDLY